MHGRRLCAEFGGGRKKCRGPNFRMTFSSKKLTLFCLSFASLTVKSHVMQHMTLFFSKNLYFMPCVRKNFISKYWEDGPTDAWAVPHLKFGGDGPPVLPLSLRPCC